MLKWVTWDVDFWRYCGSSVGNLINTLEQQQGNIYMIYDLCLLSIYSIVILYKDFLLCDYD